MTLTDAVLLINRSKKFIVLLCSILLLGAVGIQLQQRRQLPSEKLPTSDVEGDALPSSVQVRRGLKPPAKWMDVYRIKGGDVFLAESWVGTVGEKLGFASPPQVSEGEEKTFIWGDSEKWLSLSEDNLNYGLDLLNNPSLVGGRDKILPSGQEAAETVRQFLIERGFNAASRLALLETSWVAVRSPQWLDVVDESKTDAIRLIMAEKIGDIPILLSGTEGLGTLTAYVGRGGRIFKLSYSSWGEKDYELFDRYPLRSLDDALRAGKVVEVAGEGWEGTATELQSFLVTSVSSAYFADPSAGFAYPVFVFRGEGRGKGEESLQVTVLAPAVSSKWLE